MRLLEGQTIDWIGGKPPVDEPACGFLGEKCVPGPSKYHGISSNYLVSNKYNGIARNYLPDK